LQLTVGSGSRHGAHPAKFNSVQILRALAANLVVLTHAHAVELKYSPDGTVLPGWSSQAGPIGVDLFFLISGFVIIQAASRETWRTFLYARITRIYPIYWIVSSLVLVAWLWRPDMVNSSVTGEISIWKSYLLVPQDTGPLLAVGWTLTYEMYFYLVVAAMLVAGVRPAVVLAAWAAALIAMWPFVAPANAALVVLTDPITLFFIFGALLGLSIQARRTPRKRKPSRIERFFVLLGDASYSTYLVHVLVISAIWRVAQVLPWQPSAVVLAGIGFLASNAAGVASYYVLERPILRWARAFGGREAHGTVGTRTSES
jgi:peptidoglycan/LPS O-acetylase OafA/YrhL